MTKKADQKVRVWHPVYKAEAHPKRADLETWLAKGWQEQPATDPKEKDQ